MNETLKELFVCVQDELSNQLGQVPQRIILDFKDKKIGGIVQQKIGRTICNRLIEFEEAENEN